MLGALFHSPQPTIERSQLQGLQGEGEGSEGQKRLRGGSSASGDEAEEWERQGWAHAIDF